MWGRIVLLVGLLSGALAHAGTITTVDVVTVLDGKVDETVYYYRNNWQEHRRQALAAGHIDGYRLLIDRSSADVVRLLLMTDYASEAQYANRESNFAAILEAAGGPRLLNALEPAEFREVVDGGTFEAL